MNTTQIDCRNRSKGKTLIAMDICSTADVLCGYCFFNGSNLCDPGKNGGNSNV